MKPDLSRTGACFLAIVSHLCLTEPALAATAAASVADDEHTYYHSSSSHQKRQLQLSDYTANTNRKCDALASDALSRLTTDRAGCASACSSNNSCRAFEFDPAAGKNCRLFNFVPNAIPAAAAAKPAPTRPPPTRPPPTRPPPAPKPAPPPCKREYASCSSRAECCGNNGCFNFDNFLIKLGNKCAANGPQFRRLLEYPLLDWMSGGDAGMVQDEKEQEEKEDEMEVAGGMIPAGMDKNGVEAAAHVIDEKKKKDLGNAEEPALRRRAQGNAIGCYTKKRSNNNDGITASSVGGGNSDLRGTIPWFKSTRDGGKTFDLLQCQSFAVDWSDRVGGRDNLDHSLWEFRNENAYNNCDRSQANRIVAPTKAARHVIGPSKTLQVKKRFFASLEGNDCRSNMKFSLKIRPRLQHKFNGYECSGATPLKVKTTTDLVECRRLCKKLQNCYAIQYNGNKKRCRLFGEKPSRLISSNGDTLCEVATQECGKDRLNIAGFAG